MKTNWKDYLNNFENDVLIPLFESQKVSFKSEPVPLRFGKLHQTNFASFIGRHFVYQNNLSFNYYGLFKLSTGLLQTDPEGQTTIKAPVIHFSSIKIEHIEVFDKNLLLNFVSFKKFLVSLRWQQ